MASYPTSVVNWTQRIDGETVWAADPNALAAEIAALETYIGPNPQIESFAVNGATKTFSSMSARLAAAQAQTGHPFVEISRNTNWNVAHSTDVSTFHAVANPFGTTTTGWGNYLNGSGTITIVDGGVWILHAFQRWAYAGSGWVMMQLMSNGAVLRRDIFSYSQFPGSGSNAYGERFLNLDGHNEATYVGWVGPGTVIGVSSGNFTNVNPLAVQSMNLSAYFLKS
jgi:hypothetical protein